MVNSSNSGLQKIKIARLSLLNDILVRDSGDSLGRVSNYSEEFGLSLGTIQKALSQLEQENIITLEKHGKMGTLIQHINYKMVLKELGKNFILGVMPITYSQRYKWLLESIEKNLNVKIPIYFAHMRGGRVRLELVEKGIYDFAVVSKLAALKEIEEGKNIKIIYEFGPKTYVTKHVILKKTHNNNTLKIGIDKESDDHTYLTKLNFKNLISDNFVDIRYSEVIENLINGIIDVAIWNYDDVLDKEIFLKKYGIELIDLEINPDNILATEGVIVTKGNNLVIKNIFKKFFIYNKED